jgi:predicted Zn-dependent protease
VSRSDAQLIFAKAQRSYDPLGIQLTATYKKATDTTARAEDLIAMAKGSTGGTRPPGTDVVFVLTSRDISMSDGTDVVGYSDCVGGIRFSDRAFAVGEAIDEPLSLGVNLYVDGPAKTVAHEIGHLLGARHEDSNCVEGAGSDDLATRQPTVCTLMTAYLDFQSRRFGSLEAGIVRAHAEAYAAP